MTITATEMDGLVIIEPPVFNDDRGYFFESYHAEKYKLPFSFPFVQDNEARSDTGVLRGLHLQVGEHAQGKLVRVVKGAVYDVAVDVRSESATYGKWFGLLLTGANKKQLWIPRGFAHGYLVLENETIFSYKCDNYYHKPAEAGIRYDDPALSISWPDVEIDFIVSEKDRALGLLADLKR